MNVTEIKTAIESRLSGRAAEYWSNTTEQNEFVIIAQREGIEAAVAAVEGMVEDEE